MSDLKFDEDTAKILQPIFSTKIIVNSKDYSTNK